MKRELKKYMMGFMLGLAAVATVAQISWAGAVDLPPAWDQVLPGDKRFVVIADMAGEAVYDKETGLVWVRTPGWTTHLWMAASSRCYNVTAGGRKGWRLPTIEELASLVDPGVWPTTPRLPIGHPFIVTGGLFWSASTDASATGNAWALDITDGSAVSVFKGSWLYVWCVRGGHGYDAQ